MPPYKRLGRHNLVARAQQIRDGDKLRRLAAGHRQRPHAALERRHALLEDRGGGVHDARVNVPESLQVEKIGGVLGIFENVRRGLVDRHGAGARFRIRTMPRMQRAGAKAEDVIRRVTFWGNFASQGLVRHTS